jgi:hypothetical protein
MWAWLIFSVLLILIMLLIRQRWKVATEWIKMEENLTEEEFTDWKRLKQEKAENWSEKMKNFEAMFLFILSAAMLVIWYHI